MKVIVLGAGVVGVASAWYLIKAGHEVTVIERQSAAGMETSFANGGQISVSHAEPWATPHAPAQIVKWLGREDAPLLFRMRADAEQWRWGVRFLFECLPWRSRRNIADILRLALYSRSALQALRAETGIAYNESQRGILHFYTDRAQYQSAQRVAKLMASYGLERAAKTPQQIVEIEPALLHALSQIIGGDYAASDESGDAHLFTQRLAELCGQRGAHFLYATQVLDLMREGGRVSGVRVRCDGVAEQRLQADAYVIAVGSYSNAMLRALGLRVLVYPVKGYSVTIPITESARAPSVSLTDDEHKLVFTRLGERLRVAGTAELNGYDTSVNQVRCDALLKRTAELFPHAGDYQSALRWAGLRPATPSNVPYVTASSLSNLYLNTGHGTLGWTMACGSGRLLADLVSGREPEIDASAYRYRT
jgi:D-amino-acid dehydrogenase